MKKTNRPSSHATVADILATLERRGSKRDRDGMARYGIVAPKAFGVSVGTLRGLGKRIGKDHGLAAELWRTGWYEARMLAGFVDDPALVTAAQMDRWARDFDNWAICDHCCFHLFDRTPHAWRKVDQWSERRDEFVKRASFALLASLGVHDKLADDALFLRCFPLIEQAATDERNFVKSGATRSGSSRARWCSDSWRSGTQPGNDRRNAGSAGSAVQYGEIRAPGPHVFLISLRHDAGRLGHVPKVVRNPCGEQLAQRDRAELGMLSL